MLTLFGGTIFQPLDDNGNILPRGLVNFYATGTVNREDTFADADGNTANQNPVELDGQGRAVIFLGDSVAYDIVLTDENEVEVWSLTKIAASAPAV